MARVLVMEDDVAHASHIRQALEAVGHDVEWARTASAALDYIRDSPIDLLITDIYIYEAGTMTRDGGIRLIGSIRMPGPTAPFPELRDIPIIAISAAANSIGNPNILRIAESVGADYSLPKPFTSSELVSTVWLALQVRETTANGPVC